MESAFKISPRILDHLGVSAYSSLKKCLAELCSNCYDADATNVTISIPESYSSSSTITIADDGNGMSPSEIDERYLFIGYNRRNVAGDTSLLKRRPIIGNKGIGKLAGFGVANKIDVITIKDGIKSTFTLNKELFDDFATLSECNLNIAIENTNESTGTTLILQDLSAQLNFNESINKLREHLFRSLPNVPDFNVRVNGVPCSAEDVQGKKNLINHTFEGIGTITGYYIIAEKRQKTPGLVIRVRKRAVTEPSLFGLEKRAHFSFSAEKIVGEINADFLDSVINTSRNDFLEEADEVQVLKLYLEDLFTDIVNEIEKEAEGKRTKRIVEVPEVQEKLQKLPLNIRAKARKVIEGVISKLKTSSDEEVNELVDWIIKYFDSNVLRELMNSIMSADAEDVLKLSNLINEWGLKQMNNVTEIIKDQIDIIKKLEQLIDSDKALEIELHTLIEGNLWLVREGLELWSSDKPLKKVLEGYFDITYSLNADERPDVICRSRNDGNDAIIIEFKRPKVKVKMDHVTQALKYKGVIAAHRPSIAFETYVVGRTYESDVLAVKESLSRSGLYLWSFSELLQKTRARFETILEILHS